jgi:hypothetical protein
MTTKAAFNAEDWSVVTNAPLLTAILVIAADRGGTVRESMAISRAYSGVREERSGELLQAVLSTPPAIDPATSPRTPEDLRREAPATLRQAVGILERHATEDEVIAYKRFVFSLADTGRGRLPRPRRHRDQRPRAGGARRDRRDLRRGAERLTWPAQALLRPNAAPDCLATGCSAWRWRPGSRRALSGRSARPPRRRLETPPGRRGGRCAGGGA